MPSDQTHQVEPKKIVGDNNVRREADDKSKPQAHGRRKSVDRRDNGPSVPKTSNERRSAKNRRKSPEQITNEKRQAIDKIHEQNDIKLQQHRKKILLAGCEPVMGFNYDCLAMDDYPPNSLVSAAKRDRDYWLMVCCIFASLFFFGLLGFVPAWLSGVAAGLFILALVFAFSSVRTAFFQRPPLHELLNIRKKIEFSALNHIRYLEGNDGLAWRCEKLGKYNVNLQRKLFSGLFRFSKEKTLFALIKNKKHIRLYLLLMIESQKAYKRLQKDYLENHFKHLDQGWNDTISSAEAEKLEQSLKNVQESDH